MQYNKQIKFNYYNVTYRVNINYYNKIQARYKRKYTKRNAAARSKLLSFVFISVGNVINNT